MATIITKYRPDGALRRCHMLKTNHCIATRAARQQLLPILLTFQHFDVNMYPSRVVPLFSLSRRPDQPEAYFRKLILLFAIQAQGRRARMSLWRPHLPVLGPIQPPFPAAVDHRFAEILTTIQNMPKFWNMQPRSITTRALVMKEWPGRLNHRKMKLVA